MVSVETWITIVATIFVFLVLVVMVFHYDVISFPKRTTGMDPVAIRQADEGWDNLTAEEILAKVRQS